MTQRIDGAITTPDDEVPDQAVLPERELPERELPEPERPERPERPDRPVLVELASAILIVGGITAIVGWLGAEIAGAGAPASAGLLPLIVLGLNVVAMATGVAIRRGRYWRLCMNIVAIAIFLYLTAFPSPIAMFYAALDTVVLYALIHHRAWFDWKPTTDANAP